MTVPDDVAPSPLPVPEDVDVDPARIGVCPYLAAAGGAWRSASAAREHRCGAVAPPAALAPEKQRRLCLTSEHLGCATFEAARAARLIVRDRGTTLPRPLARMTPVVMDHGRIVVAMPSLRADHLSGQAVLVALMGLAFVAIVLARLSGGGISDGGGAASPTPGVTAQASPSTQTLAPAIATPVSSTPATPSLAPGSSAPPSSPRPSTTGTQTYKVKAGDTLIGIAAKFSTTVAAIKNLNGITNASSLKIGQVLQIP